MNWEGRLVSGSSNLVLPAIAAAPLANVNYYHIFVSLAHSTTSIQEASVFLFDILELVLPVQKQPEQSDLVQSFGLIQRGYCSIQDKTFVGKHRRPPNPGYRERHPPVSVRWDKVIGASDFHGSTVTVSCGRQVSYPTYKWPSTSVVNEKCSLKKLPGKMYRSRER